MPAQQEILHVLKARSAYDITEQLLKIKENSKLLQIFKFTAKEGGLRSYIIYLLYVNGKTFFWEIVKETGFSKRHVNRVLRSLKHDNIIDVDKRGFWFLTTFLSQNGT